MTIWMCSGAPSIKLRGRRLGSSVPGEPSSVPRRVPRRWRRSSISARGEVVGERPYVVVDVAHNPASLGALRQTLEAMFPGRRLILVFGMVATHDHRACTSLIAPLADVVITTTPQHVKPLPASTLAAEAARYAAQVEIIEDRLAAVRRALALARPDDVVVITGSFFLVGEVRDTLQRELPHSSDRHRVVR